MKKLLVIVSDTVSEIVQKGEYTPRYYNPGEFFDEVHLLITNEDRPDPSSLKKTVGRARLHIHNLPYHGLFYKTFGFRPMLLKTWATKGVELARRIQPDLVRCHGNYVNAFVAREIKRQLKIPYVVSMHINPDIDIRARTRDVKSWILNRATLSMEKISLREADLVMPVYQPIVPYARRMGATRIEVAYNIINPEWICEKTDYIIHGPAKIVSVGRIIREKFPVRLVEAMGGLDANLTVVGDGPQRPALQDRVKEIGLEDRVQFVPHIANDRLCKMLPEYDIFATHTEYYEISKSVLEPLLTGLPVVINERIGQPVPEFDGADFLMKVPNSMSGYQTALSRLISDDRFREKLGRRAFEHARRNWAPEKTEAKVAAIYRELAG